MKGLVRDTNVTLRRTLMACVLALVLTAMAAGAASPGSVDPTTLTPPPTPGVVAQCKQSGKDILCQTYFDEPSLLSEPVFGLSRGTLYETGTPHREGIRWYSSDGLLLRRFVTEDVRGSWGLSRTGGGPTVRFFAHDNRTDVYAIPGDGQSVSTTYHGETFTALAPGSGVLFHTAGQDLSDGRHHGAGARTSSTRRAT